MHGTYKLELNTNYKGLNLMEVSNGNGGKVGIYLDTDDYEKLETLIYGDIEKKYKAEMKKKEQQEHETLDELLTKMGD